MQIFKGIESLIDIGATAVTIGSFDGVHLGHLSLLETLKERANAIGGKSVVISFSPHPRIALARAEGLALLSSDQEKAALLEKHGVDALLLLDFNKQVSTLGYEEFITEYLIKRIGMQELIMGFNHRMGCDGGNFEKVTQLTSKLNFNVTLEREMLGEGDKISSTIIRNLLQEGNISAANRLLGNPYLMIGECDKMGSIKFAEPLKLIPAEGEYHAEVNGKVGKVVIDNHKKVWCNAPQGIVEIKLLAKI